MQRDHSCFRQHIFLKKILKFLNQLQLIQHNKLVNKRRVDPLLAFIYFLLTLSQSIKFNFFLNFKIKIFMIKNFNEILIKSNEKKSSMLFYNFIFLKVFLLDFWEFVEFIFLFIFLRHFLFQIQNSNIFPWCKKFFLL